MLELLDTDFKFQGKSRFAKISYIVIFGFADMEPQCQGLSR